MNTQKKMYVLVRKDLDPIYCGVQAGHALAEYSLKGAVAVTRIFNQTYSFNKKLVFY